MIKVYPRLNQRIYFKVFLLITASFSLNKNNLYRNGPSHCKIDSPDRLYQFTKSQVESEILEIPFYKPSSRHTNVDNRRY